MKTGNQPQQIGTLITENADKINIVNPALKEYTERQQKAQKKPPLLRLRVFFKQPSQHKTWSWDGDYLVRTLGQKYGRKLNQREACELKLAQIIQNTTRATIYDNRPESQFPVWKEYLHGKLIVDNSKR